MSNELLTSKSQNDKLKFDNQNLNEKVSFQDNALKNLESKLSQSHLKEQSLGRELAGAKSDSQKLALENAHYQNQINSLQGQNNQLNESLLSANKENSELSVANQRLAEENSKVQDFKNRKNNEVANLVAENARLEKRWNDVNYQKILNDNQLVKLENQKNRTLNNLEKVKKELDSRANVDKNQLTKMQKELKALDSKNQDLKDTLRDFAEKVVDVKDKLRNNIAKDLAREFKNANINVHVDEKTGSVVLLMNENFRFETNSYKLNLAAKKTLKKIIPIYSQVLFGNKDIRDNIQGFNVVGHASPSYQGTYVEPLSDNNKAYAYNMRLSAQRASSITNFIFGKYVGDYSYKKMLKNYTNATGRGFTQPILKQKQIGRSLASVKSKGECGPFDCYASQRVELSFTLKDDIDSLNNIINMAKDVK